MHETGGSASGATDKHAYWKPGTGRDKHENVPGGRCAKVRLDFLQREFRDPLWQAVFAEAGLEFGTVEKLLRSARNLGTSFHQELASAGRSGENRFYRALASVLGIRFMDTIDHDRFVLREDDLPAALAEPFGPKLVLYRSSHALNDVLICPEQFKIAALRDYIGRYPSIARRLTIVPPRVMRRALMERAKPLLANRAVNTLFERFPGFSARLTANAWQGFALGFFLTFVTVGLIVSPTLVLAILHVMFSLCFLSCVTLRMFAAAGARPPAIDLDLPDIPQNLPVYTVLVALYKEAEIVPDLLIALSRIVWPRSKLEIKLILEEDDLETRSAIEAQDLKPNIEIITVPQSGPRTKPKALSYTVPLISGDFVVVYDAEDTPHPGQLLEAWKRFEADDGSLACLQAPLHIRNGGRNLLNCLFAFEYTALFRGLLPALARRGLFFPLGGTSNHFRVALLRKFCDWDPYNVTEDADLAVRIYRMGYRMDMLTCPTLEDAPDRLLIWFKQRTRWFKGWMQTFLVHSRNPFATWKEMKTASFVVSQILLCGIIFSSMSYIFVLAVLASLLYKLAHSGLLTSFESAMLFIDFSNVLLGFSAFLLLGWRTLRKTERRAFWKIVLATPAYWFVMSMAAWRAAWQLYHQPFLWEKTPHGRPASVRKL